MVPDSSAQSDIHRNRLADETSPYLLQHADNPVHWYPWGEEALGRAREEGKPIFLSIGYSACHWCHVMAHESFENADTAQVMNEHFINIKVDREERPDLDQIYQGAYQLLAGRGGGWPLSMFLTPDLGPFWGGTYFPGEPRYGMPAFKDVLLGVVNHYREKPQDVQHNVTALVQGLARMNHASPNDRALSDGLLEASAQSLMQAFDPVWGGFGQAPKFPNTMSMNLLLRRWYRTGNQSYLDAVVHTLKKMAEGGIRDHLGGGFARYSVDEKWLVPHFEKMLYDNALLIPLYIDAHLASGEKSFADVARQGLDYVLREMTAPEGGFYAAQDADSEGEEGRFFVWRPGEIEELLGAADGALFCAYYGVTEVGNFEGQSILWTPEPLDEVAADFGKTPEQVEQILAAGREVLLARRAERVWPGRDDKVITAWNGLMLSAFAKATSVFEDERYLDAARRAADFLIGTLLADDGLKRCYKDGRARFSAYLDDYAFFAQGLLDLYHAAGDTVYFDTARSLMDRVQAHFAAPGGGFYFTADHHEQMITRSLSGQDQSIPSGNGVAADVLTRLHHLTGEPAYLDAAQATVRNFIDAAAMSAQGHGQMLLAVDQLIHPPATVALVGAADDAEAAAWRTSLARRYRPDVFIQRLVDGRAETHGAPWLAGKSALEGRATAYLCRAGTCTPPITDPEGLDAALAG